MVGPTTIVSRQETLLAGDHPHQLVAVLRDHGGQPVLERMELLGAFDRRSLEASHRLHVDRGRVDLVHHLVVVDGPQVGEPDGERVHVGHRRIFR